MTVLNFAGRQVPMLQNERNGLLSKHIKAFEHGYWLSITKGTPKKLLAELDRTQFSDLKGVLLEAAAMSFTSTDAKNGLDRWKQLLSGPEDPYLLNVIVGHGMGLAACRDSLNISNIAIDTLWHCMIVDGYGFYKAFSSSPEDTISAATQVKCDEWNRVFVQGVGRSLAFKSVRSGQPLEKSIEKYSQLNAFDLFSGIGLALTYCAGGLDILSPQSRSRHADALRIGSMLGAYAHVRNNSRRAAGVDRACELYTSLSVAEAADAVSQAALRHQAVAGVRSYLQMRQDFATGVSLAS